MKNVTVLAGHSGSGKTEVAVNRAIRLARAGVQVALIDLDTVNHYFRTREVLGALRSAGVRVVLPPFGEQKVDMPLVSAEVSAVLRDPSWRVLIDLGGDAVGSRVLGQYARALTKLAEMVLVVNPYRPRTSTAAGAVAEAAAITVSARLKWTGVLANPNLGPDTTAADVLGGLDVVSEVARNLKVPLLGMTVRSDLVAQVSAQAPAELAIEPLEIYLDRTRPAGE